MAVLLGSVAQAGANDFFTDGELAASKFTASASGNVTQMNAMFRAGSTFTNFHLAIYADSSGLPGTKLGETVTTSSTAAGTKTLLMLSPVAVTVSVSYWLAWLSNGGNLTYTATGTAGGYRNKSLGAGTTAFPDPFSSSPGQDTSNTLPINAEDTGGGAVGKALIGQRRFPQALLIR